VGNPALIVIKSSAAIEVWMVVPHRVDLWNVPKQWFAYDSESRVSGAGKDVIWMGFYEPPVEVIFRDFPGR